MSNGDDPGDGNRTVFRPSPLAGLGGAQPRPAASPPAATPAVAATAPAAPQKGHRLGDEGFPAPATPADIRAPLASEAGPVLALVASLRSGRARIAMADFHREAGGALAAYDRDVAAKYPEETRRAALFMLAATVDDIAGNLPSLDGSAGWEGRSLAAERVGMAYNEDDLWRQLDAAVEKPEDNADLIELAHACLAAGYQGRHRGQTGGGDELEKWSERLYKGLDHTRGLSQRFVSPQWVGFNAPLQKVPAVSIIALAAAAALVLVVLAYIGLRLATAEPVPATPDVAQEQGA